MSAVDVATRRCPKRSRFGLGALTAARQLVPLDCAVFELRGWPGFCYGSAGQRSAQTLRRRGATGAHATLREAWARRTRSTFVCWWARAPVADPDPVRDALGRCCARVLVANVPRGTRPGGGRPEGRQRR